MHSEVHRLDFDGAGVDLTVVETLVLVLNVPDVQVPVLGERTLYGHSLVVNDAPVLESQQR